MRILRERRLSAQDAGRSWSIQPRSDAKGGYAAAKKGETASAIVRRKAVCGPCPHTIGLGFGASGCLGISCNYLMVCCLMSNARYDYL